MTNSSISKFAGAILLAYSLGAATAKAANPAPIGCLYALDPTASNAFSIAGSSIYSPCSAIVESTSSSAFEMEGSETFYLQNHAEVGVVGGWQLNNQKLWDTISNDQVQPIQVTSPGDPLASIAAPTSGTIVSASHANFDMNHKPPSDTLSPGVYCGGLTVGNTNGAWFTMSAGTYIMAGGGLTINSQAMVNGTGVTVYNASSTGWGCGGSSNYTPITISGQATVTLSAPTSGALSGILFFGSRTGCSTLGSCQDQINGESTTTLNGALYFKTDQLTFSGSNTSGFMMLVADKIYINGNASFGNNGNPFDDITVSVTPATATLYANQTAQFGATVANSNNQAVTWSISPASGAGTISSSGLYTASSSVTAQQTVTITATSQADNTKTGSATVTLFPPVTVGISPASATLYASNAQQFTASVGNATNTAVTWSVNPSGVGTVSSTGVYTAPSTITAQQTVTVTTTSVVDTTKYASAVVTLLPPISVSVSPASVTLYANQSQTFTASVANTSNQNVTWSINPASGAGTINSSTGVYTAPASITSSQTVTVTATSQANGAARGTATVTLSPPVSVSVTPTTATLYGGQSQTFSATVANNSNQTVTWSISPSSGAGTINSSTGVYTAPATVTSSQTVTVTAASQANTAATGTATITLSPPVSVSVTPTSVSLFAGQSQTFTATVANSSNQTLTWSINPASGAGTINSSTGVYTAPATITSSQTVTVTAISQANSAATGTATVTLSPPVSVTVTPATVTLNGGQSLTFSATVANTTNQTVTWTISPSSGAGTINSSTGVYTSPATVTSVQTVTVTATSQADSTQSASATVTLAPSAPVIVTPSTATVSGGQTQQFTATVTFNSNTSVTWSATPSGVGSISASGLYSAPSSVSSTQVLTVTATSVADTTKSASAVIGVTPAGTVWISPQAVTLAASQTQQFSSGAAFSNTAVTWSISPSGLGTIDNTGFYTAPQCIFGTQTVTITATSVASPSVSTSATVTLLNANGYSFARAITISHNQVPNTDQTNFPFLFSTTDPAFATIANGGHVTNSNGYDIIFSTDPNGFNTLNYELEQYNPATGQVIAWVRIPTLSHTADTVLYVFYGNESITTSQAHPAAVWDSNFKGVWHFSTATTLSALDSTANANNGTINGSPTVIPGQIGWAADFAGNNDDLAIQSIPLAGVNYTISAWFSIPLPSTSSSDNTLTRGVNSDHQLLFINGNLVLLR